MNKPLVSILCVTYNHENYIEKTIESFLMQKVDFDYEIIIGEDCSKDGTKAIVQSYVDHYPDRVKMITAQKNVGGRKNVQRIYDAAVGEYIALCEGDDYWLDDQKLQMQVDYMRTHDDCSFTFHGSQFIDAQGNNTERQTRPYTESRIADMSDIILEGGGFCPTASIVFRKSMFPEGLEFFDKAVVGDYPRQIILASQGHAYYFDRLMTTYRFMHPGSWSSKQVTPSVIIRTADSMIMVLDGFDAFTKKAYGDVVDEARKTYEFEKLLQGNDYAQIKQARYASLWNAKTSRFKLMTLLRCRVPWVYSNIRAIRSR